MKKPTPILRNPIMYYSEMIKFVETKYGIKTRNYRGLHGSANTESHFSKYQRVTGDIQPNDGHYPNLSLPVGDFLTGGHTIVRNGERISATKKEYDADFKLIHEHYQRYKDWIKENPEPEYLDYWHWLLNNCFYDIHNSCTQYWGLKEILDDKDTPGWVVGITQLIYNEFKTNLDSTGELEVLIEW